MNTRTITAAAAAIGVIALAGCGATVVKAPPARSAAAACQKLAAWEQSSSGGNLADDVSLQNQILAVAPQGVAGDFHGWIQAIKAQSGDLTARANAVTSDCAAAGVSDVMNGGSAPAASVPTPTPTPTAPLTGTPGTSFTVTDPGDGSSYDVILNKVRQTVYPGEYESPATPGDHYAAAQFTIAGDTGNTSGDANIDATAIGSDGQQYSFASVMSLPNFSYGEFRTSPGIMVKGWVAFELPAGVTVLAIQWAPSFTASAATWTLGG